MQEEPIVAEEPGPDLAEGRDDSTQIVPGDSTLLQAEEEATGSADLNELGKFMFSPLRSFWDLLYFTRRFCC